MKKILNVSINKIYIMLVILISLLMLGGYFSYAMFTVTKEKSNAISIVTGNLTYKLEVDDAEGNTLTVPANTTIEFTVTLSNPNSIKARFNFYYIGNLDENVSAFYIKEEEIDAPPKEIGANLEKKGTNGSTNIYKIIVINNNDKEETIKLGVKVGLDYNDLSLDVNEHLFEPYFKLDKKEELLSDSQIQENGVGKTYSDVNLKDVILTTTYSNDINNVKLQCSGVDNLNKEYSNIELIDNGNKKYTVKSNVDGLIVATITCTLTGVNERLEQLKDTVSFKIGNGWIIGETDPDNSGDAKYFYYKKGELVTGWQSLYWYSVHIPAGQYNWYYFYDGTETAVDNGCLGEKNKMTMGWCKNVGGYTGWYYLNINVYTNIPYTLFPYGSMLSNITANIRNADGSYSSYTFNASGRCISGNGCF